MATVLKIPAKFHPITHLPETKVQKRRVAAYARVSTDSEEQQTSYAAHSGTGRLGVCCSLYR